MIYRKKQKEVRITAAQYTGAPMPDVCHGECVRTATYPHVHVNGSTWQIREGSYVLKSMDDGLMVPVSRESFEEEWELV